MRSARRAGLVAVLAMAAWAGGCALPRPVAVVRTWADLMNQPPVDLGGGVRVRLGIEQTRAAPCGGVLLYCLADGFSPPALYDGPDDGLGPLHVAVTDARGIRLRPGLVRRTVEQNRLWQSGVLYARAILPRGAARLTVDLNGPKGDRIASVVVEPDDGAGHPWVPLELRGFEGDGAAGAHMVLRGDGVALPVWDPMWPVPFDRPTLVIAHRAPGQNVEARPARTPTDPLPRLVPAAPDPTLRLEAAGTMLTLTSDTPLTTSLPELNLLARVWVNDRPLVPAKRRTYMVNVGRRVETGKALRIHLDPDLEALGAKKGDRLGLQLLYCPRGWEWAAGGPLMQTLPSAEPPAPRLTNRVEFVAP